MRWHEAERQRSRCHAGVLRLAAPDERSVSGAAVGVRRSRTFTLPSTSEASVNAGAQGWESKAERQRSRSDSR